MTATTQIMTEADTCRELVTPKLVEAGWGNAPHVIGEQRTFTNGRIIVTGGRVRRGKQKRADYLLYYRRDYPLAVVEAKELGLPAETGVQQAKEYAEILGLKFAYATNGHRIIEIDHTTGTEREVDRFATPAELWRRLTAATALREMRDAAGDSGEFYTPRPVVRFMVQVSDPRLGETVLDPACGTGGFLVEAYDHIAQQVTNPDQRRTLQRDTLFGQEAKPLPYMLAQMNLLLHGLEAPQIAYGNTLGRRITEIGHSERVDVILTNPPFGGEEEAGIKANFPANMQTAETALLFLQYIMRKLRYAGHGADQGGRAAVVVPNGTLFGDGVCAVIKEELLKEFKLHTIVRLPQGVFAPYTDIPANLLFFQRGGPTDEIWYYELPQPEGRKKYSKTAPLPFEAFQPVLDWWNNREEGPQAWRVDFAAKRTAAIDAATPHWQRAEAERASAFSLSKPIRELDQTISNAANGDKAALQAQLRELRTRQQAHEAAARVAQAEGDALYWPIYNLDLKNPHAAEGLEHADPKDLVAAMRAGEEDVLRLLGEIEALVAEVQG